jgi:soluble lytic murein transglycosylase-like protein
MDTKPVNVNCLWNARCLIASARAILIVALAFAVHAPEVLAEPHEIKLAAVFPGAASPGYEVALPRILSDADRARYLDIFSLQERGKWKAADKEIARLENDVLMGYVLEQRYMHPTAYRSRYRELRDWLKLYADHPQAARIYKLALTRRLPSASWPRRPVLPLKPVPVAYASDETPRYVSSKPRSRAKRHRLRDILAHMRRHMRRYDPKGAEKHLGQAELINLADKVEYDMIRAKVAHSWFLKGNDGKALDLALASIARSGRWVPLAHWTAGLVSFRQGELDRALEHFGRLAASKTASGDMVAGAAYWAARVSLLTRRPEMVSRLLARAAEYPRSFYGLMAQRALGVEPDFAWGIPTLTEKDLKIVLKVPAARRALALAELGMNDEAEREIKRLEPGAREALAKTLLAISIKLELPAAQLRLGRRLTALDGRQHEAAIYPLPGWEPASGYMIDRALIFAFMRQESQFNTRARSRVGARGLMQLMPATAAFISQDRRYRSSRRKLLYVPEISIELGQKYILYLAREMNLNLIFLIAGYNGGPGNVSKWRRRNHFNDDPLLFIESVPARETRHFVKLVMINLWIYRARMAQATPSLDALVSGQWPSYTPLDPTSVAAADVTN